MIVPNYFEDPNLLHIGTEPNRSYYIPASKAMEDLVENREKSDRFMLLNGEYRFRYCESVHDFAEKFYEEFYYSNAWDTVTVPGVWQNQGYDTHQYTNVAYPIPVDPPYVPWENPCGAYRHSFVYTPDAAAPKVYLNFEGVDSCFYVWLNGKFLGYSQVSHATAEFDVSDVIRAGQNTLAVLVLKWCDGTYLEDQDKFRTTGIFRDVYLLKRPVSHISDYFTTTDPAGRVRVRFAYAGDAVPTKITVLRDGVEVAQADAAPFAGDDAFTHEGILTVKDPVLWNPEQPYLYTLRLETPGEVITDRLGFRQISIQNNTVLLNGQPFKFRGINRHDSDPVTGPVISLEHMQRDLRMFKEYNFNAIRTSHYPNAPVFYQLCDQYGFLVMDEADNESHGASKLYSVHNKTWDDKARRWNALFANNPNFQKATVDRTQLCVQRDKNRPCVISWSMGNESAYGCCFEAALAWTKAYDSSRLTHYESARYHDDSRKYDFSNIDLLSRMYPSLEELHTYARENPDKPFVMCEYAHAMGNGPGDLEDYWQVINSYDVMCGGFVWEWCDHAVYKGQATNGKPVYWYGGDHGEYPHDGNFCVDGMVYPDRRPHTGLMEYKNVNRPARVCGWNAATGVVRLHNYMDFVALDQYLTMSWELSRDGEVVATGAVEAVPSILPHAEGELKLPFQLPKDGRCHLRLQYFLKEATQLLPAGYLLGFDQILLRDVPNSKAAKLMAENFAPGELVVEESDRYIIISGQDFTYRFDKRKGMFCEMSYNGQVLLQKPMEVNIWRAPTDNDRVIKNTWREACYNKTVTRAYKTVMNREEDSVTVESAMSVSAIYLQRILDLQIKWTILPSGTVTVQIHARRNPDFPELPRFGIRMLLPKEMDKVRYCGLGPIENYADKRRACYQGIFESTVEAFYEDYIRPQEHGSRSGCSYVELEGKTLRLTATGPTEFSFNASLYTQEELTEKAHNYELEECGNTVFCLDYKQNGIGSNSCGPRLLEQYRLDEETIDFTVRLIPAHK